MLVRGQIFQTYLFNVMAEIQDTDTFLVNRSGQSYQVEAKGMREVLLDNDLMLVNRDGVSYKATGLEIKDSLGPQGLPDKPSIVAPPDGAGVSIAAESDEITAVGTGPNTTAGAIKLQNTSYFEPKPFFNLGRTFMLSFWYKPGPISSKRKYILSGGVHDYVYFDESERLRIIYSESTSPTMVATSYRQFNENRWYHIFLRHDTTQSTSAEKVKLYVDGELETWSTYAMGAGTGQMVNPVSIFWHTGNYQTNQESKYSISEFICLHNTLREVEDFGFFGPTGEWNPKPYTKGFPDQSVYFDFADPNNLNNNLCDNSLNPTTIDVVGINSSYATSDKPSAQARQLTVASAKDFSGDSAFQIGDDVQQDSGYRPVTNTISNVNNIQETYGPRTYSSRSVLQGEFNSSSFDTNKMFDGSQSTYVVPKSSNFVKWRFTTPLDVDNCQVMIRDYFNRSSVPTSQDFFSINDSDWFLSNDFPKIPGDEFGRCDITQALLTTSTPTEIRELGLKRNSSTGGAIAAIWIDGTMVIDNQTYTTSQTELTLSGTKDTENFQYEDEVNEGGGEASGTIRKIEPTKLTLTDTTGTWNTGKTVQGQFYTAATATLLKLDASAKTLLLADSDEIFPNRWVSNAGKYVIGEEYPSKDAAPAVQDLQLISTLFSSTPVGTIGQVSASWQVALATDPGFTSPVAQSLNDTTNLNSWPVVPQLDVDTKYVCRVKHESLESESAWSDTSTFKTLKERPNLPTATPASIAKFSSSPDQQQQSVIPYPDPTGGVKFISFTCGQQLAGVGDDGYVYVGISYGAAPGVGTWTKLSAMNSKLDSLGMKAKAIWNTQYGGDNNYLIVWTDTGHIIDDSGYYNTNQPGQGNPDLTFSKFNQPGGVQNCTLALREINNAVEAWIVGYANGPADPTNPSLYYGSQNLTTTHYGTTKLDYVMPSGTLVNVIPAITSDSKRDMAYLLWLNDEGNVFYSRRIGGSIDSSITQMGLPSNEQANNYNLRLVNTLNGASGAWDDVQGRVLDIGPLGTAYNKFGAIYLITDENELYVAGMSTGPCGQRPLTKIADNVLSATTRYNQPYWAYIGTDGLQYVNQTPRDIDMVPNTNAGAVFGYQGQGNLGVNEGSTAGYWFFVQ